MQIRFLGCTAENLHDAGIGAASCKRFRLLWLGTAGASMTSLPRYEALQESFKDDYTLFVVEKDRLALIISNIAVLYRE